MRNSGRSLEILGPGGFSYASIGLAICGVLFIGLLADCTGFSPTAIQSPDVSGNTPPTLTVSEPNEDLAIGQGQSFIVRWTDRDPDDNAFIDIDLVQIDGANVFEVAGGIRENDVTADLFIVNTESVVTGEYFVRLTISDGTNTPVVVFAENANTGNRVRVVISPPGTGIQNLPPQVFVVEPQTNVGVSQSDVLIVSIRPTIFNPGPQGSPDPGPQFHYDREDPVDVTILLDLDDDPTNDDFKSDDDPGNIILERDFIGEGAFLQRDFPKPIDVEQIPVRQDGLPYFIRATVTDGLNTTHSYASGRLFVLKLVEGSASSTRRLVDLVQVGKTLAGNRWLGFNPLANLGTKMTTAMDQDNDGVGDFMVVAQFGNPRNLGNIGEVYLIYGRQLRFGGDININSVAIDSPSTSRSRIRGTVFHAASDTELAGPFVIDIGAGDDRRIGFQPLAEPYTLGITDVVAIDNLGSGDIFGACSLPELLIGIPHSEYQGTTRDDDPGDDPDDDCGGELYCYPDDLPNNHADDWDDDPSFLAVYREAPVNEFAHEEKLGTVALIYSENNLIAIDVEDDDDNIPCNNNVAPTTTVFGATAAGSQLADDSQKYFGVRFNVAIFDNLGHFFPGLAPFRVDPLNAHYGMNVGVLPDIDLNGLPEIIISAPRNEIETRDLLSEFGEAHPHIASRLSRANIIVFMGQNFRAMTPRLDGTSHIPFLSARPLNPGSCGRQPDGFCGFPRRLETEYDVEGAGAPNASTVRPGWFLIRGEEPGDKLGGATSAGDFNLDGPADILCGAPFADPELDTDNNGFPDTEVFNAGIAYVVYNRFPFGDIELSSANFPDEVFPRSPMLRIFGESVSDHLGLRQESGKDINGDTIDDVIIASEDYNGPGGKVDNGLVAVVFGGQRIDGDRVVSQIATTELLGTRIYGTNDGDSFGADISPGGDFNQDGLGDLLISAPGETVTLPGEDKPRHGVVYLIFGGKHLENKVFTADQIGTEDLPGIVFVGPYQIGTRDAQELDKPVFVTSPSACELDQDGDGRIDNFECLCNPEIFELQDCDLLEAEDGTPALITIDDAAPSRVGFIGDVNGDGFDDIMIGNPTADFVDPSQPGTARRVDAGEAYLIYGNNFGANTLSAGL